jgi:hypothetical protein
LEEKEILSIKYGENVINFSLSLSEKKKTVGITVTPNCHVHVIAPKFADRGDIFELVENKCAWITKQLRAFNKVEFISTHKDYKSGSSVRYFGSDLVFNIVEIDDGDEYIKKIDKSLNLRIKTSTQQRINLFVEEWLRQEALLYISAEFNRCYKLMSKHGIEKPKFSLRNMKNRWGSCMPNGTIFLNPSLIWLDKPLITYVIMHEMCHLKYQDHSKDFYSFLDMVIPEWEFCERKLEGIA